MDFDELKVIGFSNGEVKVYSAILDTGISTINAIHEKTGMERRAIYDILNKLIEKGVVSYTLEKGKRTYQSANPHKISEQIQKKKLELQSLQEKLPEMSSLYASKRPSINSEIYRGKEGIKAIFEDMLNYRENLFIGGGWYIVKELPHFWAHYNEKRIQNKVKWKNLLRYELRKEKIPDNRLMSVKFLPKEFSGSPSVIFMYGNKVANVLWGDEFFAFLIESREIAENYKRYFNHLWNTIAKNKRESTPENG